MTDITYEKLTHQDVDFPIIFHYDVAENTSLRYNEYIHWHESIEFLYFVRGRGQVSGGMQPTLAEPGDIVVVNPSQLHHVTAVTPSTEYYCLIADPAVYCEALPEAENVVFSTLLHRDGKASAILDEIAEEMQARRPGYKQIVKADIIRFVARLLRRYRAEDAVPETMRHQSDKIRHVKQALVFMQNNLSADVTIDRLCHEIGLSKYYFCRVFKEVTGRTAIDYLNMLRCQYARNLLLSGKYSVTQTADLAGFNNVTYFCSVYKKQMGCCPSQTKKRFPFETPQL